jgi:hypothetical protein
MINCLQKTIDKIDQFQEECQTLITGLKRLLGEDSSIFTMKEDDDGVIYVYKDEDLILTQEEDCTYVSTRVEKNGTLVKEAMKFLKKSLNEAGGSPAPTDFSKGGEEQQLGGMPVQESASKFQELMQLMKQAKMSVDEVIMMNQNIAESYKAKEITKNEVNKLLDKLSQVKVKERFEEEGDTDLRSKVEKFLKQFPNPQDNMVHGLAKKLGVSTDKIEEIFYQVASDSVDDKESIDETSVADIAINTDIDEPKLKKKLKESATFQATAYDNNTGNVKKRTIGRNPNQAVSALGNIGDSLISKKAIE